ncbi:u2 small nuclear ribonucleoprotein B''-like protein [Polychytrium aggregatum]|uniref:u2 small nuclear ribonucleoprotein B''-like protein n=1 Tax=Polychytrium aggregatum TaxID=110093 RepID=UPI0022FDCF8E|nr:u2 small nuclear ribonucleoprotein B''-like protein [Polychytrium aggregatum]KAI9202997.1 u2 small nuclear ribonucleoprotein B''-like protein [Polychytrium aggregatum]
MSTIVVPSQTLYVTNINGKIKKPELKRSLYALFSPYGRVLDVVAVRNAKMREQAFVVFKEVAQATAAIRGLQGFPFYDQPIKITYSRTKSNILTIMEGSMIKRSKLGPAVSSVKAAGPAPHPTGAQGIKRERDGADDDHEPVNQSQQKRVRDADDPQDQKQAAPDVPPHRVLILHNLPPEVTEAALETLFKQYPGLIDVRLVPGKSGLAFVEYEQDSQGAVARTGLNGFKLTQNYSLVVEYAKK